MNKYTPGPWKIDTRSTIKTPVNASAKHIAMVNFCKNGSERDVCGSEHDANARLIAAAPELLAVCEKLAEADKLAMPDGTMYMEYIDVVAEAREMARGIVKRLKQGESSE